MVQVEAEVRDAILEAAARLFEEKGYVGTSISEIGQAAGVASSTSTSVPSSISSIRSSARG
jgi:AcrR family transcriptional regulator